MSIALNAAVSAAQIAKIRLEVLANNVANKNTIGYKASDIRTSDLFYTTLNRSSASEEVGPSASQTQVGHGAKVASIAKVMTQGALKQTNSPLDLMINGAGYFAITLPDGTIGYTRDGSFTRNNKGVLTTRTGEPLVGDFKVDGDLDTLVISDTGDVTITDNKGDKKEVGKIKIYTFQNEQGLSANKSNFLLATQESGEPEDCDPGTNGAGTVVHKALESSNIDSITSIMDLMDAQNTYEMAFRILETVNKMENKANDVMSV